ncbi:indolepyruvate ferredoxin oxidoreductase beta subunit [Thermodesulfovibrio aggregans]|uniref:Indolepyruvate ferredoxin oxidoreductase beta subunit n=1 Tax=Thermodesulfovibrio aggregans TaxID=86166 RepID=A0A0U9HLI9_9BACT|nr:indolepyruvate oxidoreductase subunit beta [Thermodesulfovibrio aggregans]GAQ93975.1 indolepyruvate ferredoxin oxidoreductase beta subunit [Thermodesulfovibrio aggregans]
MLTTNIIISGTGGQGIILASRIITHVAFQSGYDVKESEIHGMAQRGGSVVSHIRFGDKVFSPQIPAGEAQIMVALEELEALRYLRFLKKGGLIILNKKKILPAMTEEKDYPQNVENLLEQKGFIVIPVEAEKMAKQIGNIKIENSVILGILSTALSFKEEIWHDVISKAVPPKTIELNIKAFNEGRRLIEEDAILEQRIRNFTEAKT